MQSFIGGGITYFDPNNKEYEEENTQEDGGKHTNGKCIVACILCIGVAEKALQSVDEILLATKPILQILIKPS